MSEKAEIDAIESEVGLQVEEMIVEVQKELKLIPQMAGELDPHNSRNNVNVRNY